MTQLTRSEKVERHFRNSVREKTLGLMSVLDPGEQLRWGSLEYDELLKAARDRIDAELLNDENFQETPELKCATVTVERNPTSLQEPGYHTQTAIRQSTCDKCKTLSDSVSYTSLYGAGEICQRCYDQEITRQKQQAALALPESAVRGSENT